MDCDSREARAASFGRVAEVYERSRPGYPAGAVRWLVGEGDPRAVLDLAAGTGKLARALVEEGYRVVAVDPSPEMLDELRRVLPGVEALVGTAEAIPLRDGTVDAVVVAQAFHWFDPDPALAEIHRVLAPGGTLGLVWNTRDTRVAWVERLSGAIGHEAIDELDAPGTIARSGLFGPVQERAFEHAHELDRDVLLDLVRSRSACAVRTSAEQEEILDQVRALWDEAAVGAERLRLPYVTRCFRATRPGAR